MRICQGLLAATIAIFLGAQAVAAEPALTSDAVARFIASYAEMSAISEKYATETGAQKAPDPLAGFLAAVTGSRAQTEVAAVVRRHGFADLAEWAKVGSRTARAFLAARYGAEMKGMQAELAKARERIEANDSLTPEQKSMILQQMAQSGGMAQMFDAPAEDLAAVAPHIEQLEAIFDEH